MGVHRFLDFERMRELLRPYADKYIALDERPDIVAKDYAMRDGFNIAFVSTFAPDEPVQTGKRRPMHTPHFCFCGQLYGLHP